MSYVLALDEGTTSCRAVIFDDAGAVVGISQKSSVKDFPSPAGWNMTPTKSGQFNSKWHNRLSQTRNVLPVT